MGHAAVMNGTGTWSSLSLRYIPVHEFGHSVQFMLLSYTGRNPWLPYLGLGLLGAGRPSFPWEGMAGSLGLGTIGTASVP
jgi:hypothetical protein